ncbi:MAG: ankyrin repeat domain-containing protein [Chromatiales bacterium]|nr:ankyrin repeat domain-containing protein [Chromatiales bacterium]
MTTRTLTTSGTVWRHEPERVARDNAYIRALTRGSRAEVEQLIAQGAPITADLLVTADSPLFSPGRPAMSRPSHCCSTRAYPDGGHFTAAADAGQVEVLKLLLSRGVDIDAFDDVGYATLHRAAGSGRTEAARFLLDRGARINLPDKNGEYGWTAPTRAAGHGHVAVAKLLLGRGADVNSTSATGRTPPDERRRQREYPHREGAACPAGRELDDRQGRR